VTKSESSVEPQIELSGFRQAQLKSERIRILVALFAVLAILLLHVIRMFVLNAQQHRGHLLANVAFGGLFVLYELAMLRAVKHALQGGQDLAPLACFGDIILETSLPAIGIAFLTGSAIEPAYRPLANPLALTFFLFIIVSVLRLNPWASVLSGWVAACSYLCASYFLGWRPLLYTHVSLQSPQRAVFGYALALLVAGGVAGAVGGGSSKACQCCSS
jgi:hypothetical protein